MDIRSFLMEGQLLIRCLKPSLVMTALNFAGSLRKWKHAFFSPWQWCCSASVRIVAAVPTSMYSHSLPSHINLSLSISYLSASTSRCWHMTSSSSFLISGNESVYKKQSSALNTGASMSFTCTTSAAVRLSLMAPKNSALKTGDRAASTHRCAGNISRPTWNTTSAPFSVWRRSARCRCRSDGGTETNVAGVTGSSARNSLKTTTSQRTVREPCLLT
jgi:hypothetical protein